VTDVLAVATKLAKTLDLIAQEQRATVLRLLIDRYQLGTLTGAVRSRRWRDAIHVTAVTEQTSLNGVAGSPTPPPVPVQFEIPNSIRTALSKSPILGKAITLQRPGFWQAEVRANPGVDFAAEVLKAEAWIAANPGRAPRRDHGRFLHNWLARAERPE